MEIIELTEENISEYASRIGEDIAENIGRVFFQGLLSVSDDGAELKGGIIWKYTHPTEDKPTESIIEWFQINEEDAAEGLLQVYKECISKREAVRSRVVIPAKDKKRELQLLRNAGFHIGLDEGDIIVASLSELSQLAIMKSRAVPDFIQPLSSLVSRRFRRGVDRCIENGQTGLCEDLAYLPMSWFDPDISFFAEKDDKICGFLLFHVAPSGMISVQLMVGFGKDFQQTILGMMRKFIITLEEHYPPDTKVELTRRSQASMQLAEKLLPRGIGIPVYAGSREES